MSAPSPETGHTLDITVVNLLQVIAGGAAIVTGSCRCGWKWPHAATPQEAEVRTAYDRAHKESGAATAARTEG
jgi:hypothetical protein